MANFIPARILKTVYSVAGHFYDVQVQADHRIRCRSVLEIFESARFDSIGAVRATLPDAVFVMMNPGSSSPLRQDSVLVAGHGKPSLRKTLVPTKPDTTQYQVMRTMSRMKWGHVRVLNLSDIREAKSVEFARSYRKLEDTLGFTDHSIFAQGRRRELQSELRRGPRAPLVCAWGVSPALDRLTCVALPALDASGQRYGLLRPGTTSRYFHPLPTLQEHKLAWVTELCNVLRRAPEPLPHTCC